MDRSGWAWVAIAVGTMTAFSYAGGVDGVFASGDSQLAAAATAPALVPDQYIADVRGQLGANVCESGPHGAQDCAFPSQPWTYEPVHGTHLDDARLVLTWEPGPTGHEALVLHVYAAEADGHRHLAIVQGASPLTATLEDIGAPVLVIVEPATKGALGDVEVTTGQVFTLHLDATIA